MRFAPAALRFAVCAVVALASWSSTVTGQSLRKIGELQLSIVGVSASIEPAAPVVPRNTPAGVRVVIRSAGGEVSTADVLRFFGADLHVEADFTGPGLLEARALSSEGESDPLLLRLPAVQSAGDYQLSNVRLVANGRPALDVTPQHVPVRVIEQVLITSVTTRPLTLEEIKGKGIVLDRDDYLAFEFTIGVLMESRPVQISFPAVFSPTGVPLPEFTFDNPQVPSPQLDMPSLPMIVPTMLIIEAPGGGTLIPRFADGSLADVRIPSVLVIPGNVGYLKQFFSAQLFVANGAPGGSNLRVRDLSGAIRLPGGDDAVVGTSDDPLSLPTLQGGTAPSVLPVLGAGPDGAPGTADDTPSLEPGAQAQAEFLIRGEREGFHNLEFDIEGVLDGLATGPATVKGVAKGAVLVRNPFFDMTFTVPSVVRRGEKFSMYVTVTNKRESGPANDLSVALDQSRMSGMRVDGDAVRQIPTLLPGDAQTLKFDFISERTGQVVASYIRFDPDAGASGQMRFTAGIGERGIALSPDTLLLPTPVDSLPVDLVEAAMRVLGQAWSISLATNDTRPAGVLPINRTMTIAKGLALAEAALRVTLGQPLSASLRDFAIDFYGAAETTPNASTIDPGFDQLLRTTDAGHTFREALGAALRAPIAAAAGVGAYQQDWAALLASGSDRITFATTGAPVDVAVIDGAGQRTESVMLEGALPASAVPAAFLLQASAGPDPAWLGLVTQPTAGPYTLELTGRGGGALNLAFSLPRGDGTTTRAEISGVPVTAGSRARLVLDPARPESLALEADMDGDGTFETSYNAIPFTLVPEGARLLSFNLVGREVFANAGPYGYHAVMLFDRVVDGARIQDTSLYTLPKNRVRRAKRVLSGRMAIVELEQPEGPHVPATVSVAGIADLRGTAGPSSERPLGSLLADPGAVVSGRVFTPDGAGVGGIEVFYSNSFGGLAECHDAGGGLEKELSRVRTQADGSFEFRWVRQDTTCGIGFQLLAQDPGTGTVRRVYRAVRHDGERIVLDVGLFGRGTVTGVVRDLDGQPVGGAHVVVVSDTDPGRQQSALADGTGRYTIADVLVGPVNLRAAKAYDNGATVRQGTAGGRLLTAGGTAAIDIVIDTGSASVSGIVTHLHADGPRPAAGALVLYSVSREGMSLQLAAGALSDADGRFSFPSVPAGPFQIDVTLNTPLRERGTTAGIVAAGETRADLSILIESVQSATVRGLVRRTDNTLVAGAMVREGDRATFTDANGAFELADLAVQPTRPHTLVAETPDRRRGTASVLVAQPGIVDNVVITLSTLGSAQFTLLDALGAPVAGQEVVVLADQFGLRGACSLGCGCAMVTKTTNAQGIVRFDDLPAGPVLTRAVRVTNGFRDVAQGRTTIITEGQLAVGVMRFEGYGSVSGVVLDPESRPAVGANVSVRSRTFNNETCTLAEMDSHFVRSDHLGRFSLPAVGVGKVSITTSHPFLPISTGVGTAITRPGEHVDVVLRLVDSFAGELSGRILLPDGVTPSGPGVEVTINGPLPDITVRTDADGAFRFAKILPAGNYTMTATDPLSGALARESVTLKAGQDLAHEMRLKGRGTVRVRVVDALDVPVSGAAVRLTETAYPSRVLEGIADAANDGVVIFERVFEGPLAVEASDAFGRGGRASAVLPAPDADVEIKVRLSVTGTVRGRFLMPGDRPIPYGVVTLLVSGRVIGQTTTAGSGEVGGFEFTYVPAGPVRLEATDPGSARTGVAVGTIAAEGEVLSLDVYAQGLGTVTGVVTAGGVAQPAAQVELVSGLFKVKALADGNGSYTIAGVPEGLVSVTAQVNGGIQSGSASATLTGDGIVLTLDVAVRDAGHLTGTVLPAASGPLPPVIVTAAVAGLKFSTTAGADGRFDFPRLPAGSVTVTADVIGSIDTARLQLTLPGSATTDVQLQLQGVGSLSGRALDSAGQPTAGHLTIDGTGSGPRYSISVSVGPDGQFHFPELLAGPVTARLRSAGTPTLHGTATAVVLPSQAAAVDVRLQDSATVTGTVVRSNGTTPAIGADAILKLTPGLLQIPVQVQADGRFVASGVPLGAFTLSVKDPFTGGVALVTGRATTVNGETVDLGTLVLDDTPLTVSAVDPADGSIGVAVTRAVIVTLSDPLQSAAGVSVTNGTSALGTTAALSNGGLTLTLTPTGLGKWPDAAELTVTISTSATDIYGRHPAQAFTSRFRTVDLSPPAVVATVPAHQAIQVPGTSAIQVTFSEPLAPESDVTGLVLVTGPAGVIPGEIAMTGPAVATFTPAAPLADNAVYSVVVNGATDVSGNQQTTAFAFTFSTLDTVAPVLTLQMPTGAWVTSARPYIQILATDNASGADIQTGALSIDGEGVAVQKLAAHLTYTPPADLPQGVHDVLATVNDRAGNPGSLPFALRVDTVAPDVPVITNLTAGEIVRGTFTIAATSSDATSGLARIRFFRGTTFIGEATEAPFQISYNATALPEGPQEFRARAVDVAGNDSGFGTGVTVTVDNDPLALTINEPAAGTRVRDAVLVRVTPSEAVSRIDFTAGSLTISDTEAPYEQTLDVTGLPEGPVIITVTGYPVVGDPVTTPLSIVADRTPPAVPDATRIDAEPPAGGISLVIGHAGAVEPGVRVEIVNTNRSESPVVVTAAGNGAFATNIGGEIDDLLSVVAIDDLGNRSAALFVVIRRVPSLPPAEGASSLRFEGLLADRVGPGAAALAMAPDGELDAVFTLTLAIGEGMTRTVSYVDLAGPSTRSTRAGAGSVLGVAADAGATLLNGPDGEIAFPILSGATLTLFAADFGLMQEGATYTATAVFTDGSKFVGTFYYVPAEDRARIAHSLVATAAPPTVVVSPGVPGTTTITLSDIRDIEGTRVPDGALVAIAVADMAAKDARGQAVRSAGGEILDGDVAPNNQAFRVFPVIGGTVQATYSSGGVVPAPVRGTLAVVQVQGADAAGNVLGTEVIGAMGINVRAATDQAIVEPAFSTVYADTGDRRVRVAVRVRDAQGNPAADGTKVVVTAASGVASDGSTTIFSAGGRVFGGADSPSGSNYRALTVMGGQAEFEYSPLTVSASVISTAAAVLQVMLAP
jgi:hypothetical protein